MGLCARDADEVQRAAGELRALGVGAHGVRGRRHRRGGARPRRSTSARASWAAWTSSSPTPAARPAARALEETTAADWEQTLALNVVHPAVLMRAALPHLRARGGGAAVLIASISGTKPQPRAQYAAAKAAEIHLAHTLARELGPDGIRVNALSPGSILFEGGGWAQRRDARPRGLRRVGASASSRGDGSARRRRSPTSRPSCSPSARAGSAAPTSSSTARRTSPGWRATRRRAARRTLPLAVLGSSPAKSTMRGYL